MNGTSDQSCWLAEACKILLLTCLRRENWHAKSVTVAYIV